MRQRGVTRGAVGALLSIDSRPGLHPSVVTERPIRTGRLFVTLATGLIAVVAASVAADRNSATVGMPNLPQPSTTVPAHRAAATDMSGASIDVLGDGTALSDVVSRTYGRNTPPTIATAMPTEPMAIAAAQPFAKPAGLLGGLLGFTPPPVVPPGPTSRPVSPSLPETTYHTVCVRLCDGSYIPMSFSTTREHFDADEAKCNASCDAPSRLFAYETDTGSPATMVDVAGTAYTSLATAFKFKTTYDPACKCRAHPWEHEALARHRAYAETGGGPSGTLDVAEVRKAAAGDATPAPSVLSHAQQERIDSADLEIETSSTQVLAVDTTLPTVEHTVTTSVRIKQHATGRPAKSARPLQAVQAAPGLVRSASADDIFRASFGR